MMCPRPSSRRGGDASAANPSRAITDHYSSILLDGTKRRTLLPSRRTPLPITTIVLRPGCGWGESYHLFQHWRYFLKLVPSPLAADSAEMLRIGMNDQCLTTSSWSIWRGQT